MTNFSFPSRFDETQAEDGVWFEIDDELGNVWGKFLCALVDTTTQRYRTTIERLQRKYAGNKAKALKARSADDFTIEVFVELSLLDWELHDDKGKAIPFSKDTAIAYFSDPRALFVIKKLSELTSDVTNYQPEDQGGELPEGN